MTEPVVDFGRDISCTTSLRTGRFVTKTRLIAEADFRRLTTPRGMLRGEEEEENYGFDLLELIGSATTKADAAALPGRIRSELMKDERHETVEVKVTTTREGPAVAYDIEIEATTSEGPFTLAIRASEVTVELLGIKADEP